MITITDGHRVQTPESGNILKWEETYSYEVALGEGMPEWDEVPETQAPQPDIIDTTAEIIN